MRKLSLIAAALVMAFAFQTPASAADAAEAVEEAAPAPEANGFFCPCLGQGPGPRAMMWRNRPGMMGRPGMMNPGMMRQGWRGRDGSDDNGDDSRRGRRFGRGDRDERNARFGALGPRFMDELELTDDQRKQMIDIATENFRERLTLRWELEKAQNALEDLEDGESTDYDAVVAANAALGGARGKLDVARRKVMDQFASVLTEEQRATIEQYREDRQERREERRGERRDRD